MICLKLYFIFFKIGLFTIGGGLASLPLLKEAVVDSGMVSQHEFVDMLAISQSTPGPIGINMATFAGCKIASVAGGIAATLGIVSPSLIIIIMIAAWMRNFASHPVVKSVMRGIRPAALGLIGSAAWFVFCQALFIPVEKMPRGEETLLQHGRSIIQSVSLPALLLLIAMGIAFRVKPASPVVYILAGGLLGILIF
ncbi:MAG: chromate transporter [Verrucomicrobiota bacterium]|jgi:chromate transporter|nr:chromate transporter [Verrucomicrobiota bacterium]